MSDRIHIGPNASGLYDCVVTGKGYPIRLGYGPWQIRIGDLALFREIEPRIAFEFYAIGEDYPACVWCFISDDSAIEHPTREELDVWLKTL